MDESELPATRWQWLSERLDELQQQHLLRKRVVRSSDFGCGRLRFLADRRSIVNFGTNDYLGIAAERAAESHEYSGIVSGSGASPLVSGYGPCQAQLESELAAFEHCEAAVVLPTGYAANLAVMSTLPESGDLILSDQLNHASIIDGCRLSHAERFVFPHRDVAAVGSLLKAHRHRFHRSFLVTDSVFSMDGDIAPLVELAQVCQQYQTILVVDEAHGTGVLGPSGGGVCEQFSLISDEVPIRVGTLSKAIGLLGGFVAGPQVVVDYLVNRARPLIYSTAMPETLARAASESLRIVAEQPQRRARLVEYAALLQTQLRGLGFRVAESFPGVPIVPVILKDSRLALECSERLLERGFYVPAIRPPTVPANAARLRISFSAAHEEDEIAALIDAFQDLI